MKYLFGLVLFISPFCQATQSQFVVRDSQTGRALNAVVSVRAIADESLSSKHWQTIKQGQKLKTFDKVINAKQLTPINFHYQITSNNFIQLIDIQKENYQSIYTYIEAHSSNRLSTIFLDPININKTQTDEMCEQASICGYVYDKANITPLENAVVELSSPSYRVQVKTDSNGRFVIDATIKANSALTIQAKNHQSAIWTELPENAPFKLIVDLKKGSGIVEKSMHHPLNDVLTNSVEIDWLDAKLVQTPSSSPEEIQERSTGAIYLVPPANIRVGFNASGGTCCGSNCSTSQVYSLETYVQHGLDNEWISSWNSDSLKAGSIPYRSYGAWHVLNGTYPGYDICAGPCCQAYGDVSYTTTRNAAKATNGIMLDKNGAISRSEYSAQNNAWDDPNDGLSCTNSDLSCGNGFVGSPATGWSCLADPLSTNRGCFGHGRGMSQWGTQYHAQNSETFADIVDFYYNANNNPTGNRSQYASSPIRLDMVTVNNSSPSANDVVVFDFEIFNSADASLDFGTLLLGTSITNGVDIYSDPPNDLATTLNQAGTVHVQRNFQLPSALTTGNYDGIFAIYLDVNGDNAIQSGDWLLMKTTVPNMLNIQAATELLFENGFE